MSELEIQREIIKSQQRQINALRHCNRVLETTNQLLADALDSLTKTDVSSKAGGVDGYAAIELFLAQNL